MNDDIEEMDAPTPIVQLPEHFIRQSAEEVKRQFGDIDNNIFAKMLEASQQFKDAGMTPIYLYDCVKMQMSLITLETMDRGKLH